MSGYNYGSPVHCEYESESARLCSFKNWPICAIQRPEDLSEAGFFYEGSEDKTICFHCDGGLKDWTVDDVAWVQHARCFPRCAYVNAIKGKLFVQMVITEAGALPAIN